MSRQLIHPPELHPSPGFSHVATANGSRLIFVSGQVALDQDFGVIGVDDLAKQTAAAMTNLGIALAAVDASWGDVVRRTIYTTEPTEFETITAAIEIVQGSTEHPAQTIVGITGLAVPGLMIEIEATVVLP